MKYLAIFSLGFSATLGLLYTVLRIVSDTKEDAFFLAFLYEIRPMFIVLTCIVLALPGCVVFLLEERFFCYKSIGNYLTQKAMINRYKENGHGNSYTENEQKQLDRLSGIIRKLERRVQLIETLLINW